MWRRSEQREPGESTQHFGLTVEDLGMPRYARFIRPGSLVHVISRYLNREFLVQHDEERAAYLEFLGQALDRSDWLMLSYGLMSSHNHWGAIAGLMPFSRLSLAVNSRFARWYNRRHGRLGPMFADRPKTLIVSPLKAAYLIGYQHNNPARAGVVPDATESTWTSHQAYLGLADAPPWLQVKLGLKIAGFEDDVDAFAAYVRNNALQVDPVISGHNMDHDRRSIRAAMNSAVELGSPAVSAKGTLSYPLVGASGALERACWRGSLDRVLKVVSSHTLVPEGSIRSKQRSTTVAYARQLVVLTSCHALGRRQTEVASYLNMSAQGVNHHLRHASGDARGVAVALGDVVLQAACRPKRP
jgi:hypothetical protein